jgi:hypothetical protein
MSNITIVSKISTKKVCGKIAKPDKKTLLMQVFGVATGTKLVPSPFGEAMGMLGQFRATNLVTGEVFQSGVCFLPIMGLNMVAPMIAKEGVEGVQFALLIGVVPAENAFGYEYYVEPIMQASESDPLEILAKKVTQTLLAAPEAKGHKAGR